VECWLIYGSTPVWSERNGILVTRADGAKRGILHNFQANHRLAIAPLGYVVAETRANCLMLSTFHTFPEENTIIKSQTLIEKQA
jgi:hypothetical protein